MEKMSEIIELMGITIIGVSTIIFLLTITDNILVLSLSEILIGLILIKYSEKKEETRCKKKKQQKKT